MTTNCTRKGSILVLTAALGVYGSSLASADQKPEVQRLFQSGAYEQAVAAAADGDPASTYLAAQSLIKLDRTERAVAELTRLRASENPAWRLIGESGEAVLANDGNRAVDVARCRSGRRQSIRALPARTGGQQSGRLGHRRRRLLTRGRAEA
jgi:hypothetical protein